MTITHCNYDQSTGDVGTTLYHRRGRENETPARARKVPT